MEIGTDVTKLNVSKDIIKEEIEYKGKIWQFEFKEISWLHKKKVRSEMMEMKTTRKGETVMSLNMEKFHTRMFQLTNTKAPDGFNITTITSEFGELLEAVIPGLDKEETIDDDEIKN